MTTQNKWMPIKKWSEETGIEPEQIPHYVKTRQWYDGFVVKKSPTGRWMMGSLDDFYKWMGLAK